MQSPFPNQSLFAGNGEVRSLLSAHDWSDFPFGSPEQWPPAVTRTIQLILDADQPMSFLWGGDLLYFYNDAYIDLVGNKHPAALTRPFWENRENLLEVLSPLFQDALGGKFSTVDNMAIPVDWRNKPAIAYFSFSLLPIFDQAGQVIGILNPCVQTTSQVIADRQQKFELQLADRIRSLADPDDVAAIASELLGTYLQAARVVYGHAEDDGERIRLMRDWTDGELKSIGETDLRLDDFGSLPAGAMRVGNSMIIDDVKTDARSAMHAEAYDAIGVRSFIALPLMKAGRLHAILSVHDAKVRQWTDADVAMVAATVDRTWSMVESARAHADMRRTASRLQFILDSAQIGEWELDLANDRAYRSRRHDMCFGYAEPVADWGFDKALQHFHPDDRGRVKQAFEEAISNLSDWHFECRVIWPDDTLHWIAGHGSVYGVDSTPTRMTGIVYDITERKAAEEKVRHAALHDSLTGLPNRAMLFEYAGRLLPHNRRTNRRAAMLFMDLDRFKPINDNHGHDVGDAVLKAVADRLSRTLRAEDIVVRIGGDEFVVLLQDIKEAAYAGEVAMHIVDRIGEPFQVSELTLSLSTSIGISIFPDDAQDIDTLISQADAAMYQAKQAGRNNFQFYSEELTAGTKVQLAIERQLRSALHSDAFHLCYQPVINLESGEIESVEALLRWHDADIGPERFVPIAEASGIINPIGRWVLKEASRQYKAWIANGLPAIPIAVNVSPVEFRDRDFVSRFERLIEETGIEPTALQMELTETAVMDDIEHAVVVLGQLKALGVTILLDDFGTGHSSLAYLARLPLDKIKIDKSFIAGIETDVASRAVMDAMVALGLTLDLKVVAEGIESEATLDYVRSHGCQQAQGFYFSRPMTGPMFETWCRTYSRELHAAVNHEDRGNRQRLG